MLLLGVSGTGKSAFAKALGTETGRPTLLLDIGALMGSLVGQTEANIRQALRIADADGGLGRRQLQQLRGLHVGG